MSAVGEYFHTVWLAVSTVAIGMKITFKHLFVPAVTLQYPDVKMKLPERARNRLYVNIDDCIGCDQCSMACPVDCIIIETIKSTPDQDLGVTSTGHKKRLHVPKFDIDIAKCCYCGLCVPPCPTECIVMTDVFEFSEFDRKNLIYNFSIMTPGDIEVAKEKLKKAEAEAAAKKAAAAAAAAAAKASAAAQPAPPAATPAPSPKPEERTPGQNPQPGTTTTDPGEPPEKS
jgi:formate hydrogenlyase subunit 6/NADH:ubiquinone oxidoreductase subunit I